MKSDRNEPTARTAALILAGGMGRRWGRPKAEARLPDGRTFLQACTDCVRAAGVTVVVATLPPGFSGPVPAGLTAAPLPTTELDMFASAGLGLRTAIEDPSWHRILLYPVDHPLVASSTIQALAAQEDSAVIPAFKGRHGHPILINRTVAEAVASGRQAGPTLREVLAWAQARDLDVDDPGIRANCNTPEQLRTALDLLNE